MSRCGRTLLLALALVGVVACGRPGGEDGFVIVGASVHDGSGGPAQDVSVRVEDGRITAVGAFGPRAGEAVIEAPGLVLAPGFVDTHSHADLGLDDDPGALGAVSQGITTIVVGQDGGSPEDLDAFFQRLDGDPVAVNVASYSGHGRLRATVMGEDFRRPARADEVARMAQLLRHDLDAGALGLSSGLEYDPGIYATTDEVVALARVAASVGGRYISHVRSEDRALWRAVDEAIDIGHAAGLPVQLSHVKLAMRSLHGQADRLLARLEQARAEGIEITADVYPYTYWQSTLTVLFPDRDFADPEAARFAVRELAAPDAMVLSAFAPEPRYVGSTVAEIAAARGTPAAQTLSDLIAEAQAHAEQTGEDDVESVIATSMHEADIGRLLGWAHTNLCSDGGLGGGHPRGFGAFPRLFRRHVRERGDLTLAQAVAVASARGAEHMGFAGRGRIAVGQAADLVLFDPEAIEDRATIEDSQAVSEGVERVWVAGVEVFAGGRVTGARPGRVLRRGEG